MRAHAYSPLRLATQSVGDVDNLAKFVLDAMNGVFFDDDSQIVELTVRKCYADEHEISIMLEAAEVEPPDQARKRPRR